MMYTPEGQRAHKSKHRNINIIVDENKSLMTNNVNNF